MIRTATFNDIDAIHALVNFHAWSGQVLPRTREEILANIGDFRVYEELGTVLGVCAISWNMGGMVEIRSLVVHPEHCRRGVGTALARHCVDEATRAMVPKVFVLTYARTLFEKLGFYVIHKSELPQKIWKDCQGCRKRDFCDEIAMIRDLAALPVLEPGAPGIEEASVPA